MSEQDHASLRDKQRRAIREVMPNVTDEECDRLAGALAEIREDGPHNIAIEFSPDATRALSEFVRGIVREEMHPRLTDFASYSGKAYSSRAALDACTCPWFPTAPLSSDCPVHGVGRKPCTCVVPVSSRCPVHGMKTAPHHHHRHGRSGIACTDVHEEE